MVDDPLDIEITSAESQQQGGDPGIERVYKYLVYGLSLPERALRSTTAMVAGALHESASLLIPQGFRDSQTYRTFIQQNLDFLSRSVGGVVSNDSAAAESNQLSDFVARKAVGNFLDLAGMATMHMSPLTVLAVVSDVAYGSKTYLNELGAELKRQGIIAEDSTIDGAADLLQAISHASNTTSQLFDQPPLNIDGLRETIARTVESVSNADPTAVFPKSEIERFWNEMRQAAQAENSGLFELSSALSIFALNKINAVAKGSLTTVQVTGRLIDRHLLDHYWQGLEEISNRGLYGMLAEASQPYIEAVWKNFVIERPTVTGDLISGKLIGRV